MRTDICSGSFDPITLGHLDIIRRAATCFDKVWVCVRPNAEKKNQMFTPEQKLLLVKTAVADLPNVEAELFRHGKSLGTFVTTEPVTVKPRTVAEYSLKGQARLSDGVSLFSVLALMKNFNMAEYSISYSASVKIRGGGHVTLRKKDVPLNELFEEVEI